MVHHFTFNEPLVKISQVEWCFILDGIKIFVFASFFNSTHCFLFGFHHHDFRGKILILCCIDFSGICAKLHFTWLILPNLVNIEACVIRALIQSNNEIREGKFDPLLSSMSSIVICCVLALVFLVLAKILIGLKGTNPKPTLEGLNAYPCYFNFFWALLRPCIFSPIVSGLSSSNRDDKVKSYPVLANNL